MENKSSAADGKTQFEGSLRYEITHSEQLRAAVLALIFLVLFLLASLVPLMTGRTNSNFGTDSDSFKLHSWYLLLLASFASFEGMLWALMRFAGSLSVMRFRLLGYLTALFEISIPTALILVMAQVNIPSSALNMPPVFLYFIFISLAALRLDRRLCVFIGAVAAAQYFLVSLALLSGAENVDPMFFTPVQFVGKPLLLFVAGVGAAFVTDQVRKQVERTVATVGEHQRVLGIFGRHVSPAVLARLVKGGLEGETREICVLFLDIRGFTSFAESRQPAEVVDYLNTLFAFMVEIIGRHGGTVNKFLGDGFMALFGAPVSTENDSANAVQAALEIQNTLARAIEIGQVPPTRIGIGIHRGEALTGLIGSVERQEYSVIGDVVNLASRVEALNKKLGTEILITQKVWAQAGGELMATAKALGPMEVRGREARVELYSLALGQDAGK